jgi:hypothetical protein
VALASTGLAAVSLRLAYYSVESRGYALQTALFLVSLIAADRVISERSKRWPIIYCITATLAFWSVLIHLYALVSVGLWMLACANRENVRRVITTQLLTAGVSVAVYTPIGIYIALFGTKIEGSEPWSQLPTSIAQRAIELFHYWRSDLTDPALAWLVIGAICAVTEFRKRLGGKLPWLLTSLFVGPLLVFILTKRPAPFARVWTYLLPVLFGFAAIGWVLTLSGMRSYMAARTRQLVLVFVLLLPIALMANRSRTDLPWFRSPQTHLS